MHNNERQAYIDSLRGIAVFLVILAHSYFDYFYFIHKADPQIAGAEWEKQLVKGTAGVILFFAISGYIIPKSFQGNGIEAVKQFVVRRFFRMYPLFWISILPRVFLYFLGNRAYSLDTIILNFTMVAALFNRDNVLGLYWTLPYELLFYFLCLIFFLLGWNGKSQKISIVILALTCCYWIGEIGEAQSLWHIKSTYLFRILIYIPIMLWASLWRLWIEGEQPLIIQKMALVSIPLHHLAVSPIIYYFSLLHSSNFEYFLAAAPSFFLAILLFMLGTTYVKLKFRPLAWFGMISYSLYLFHVYVLRSVYYSLEFFIQHRTLSVINFFEFFAPILMGSTFVAVFCFYFVERPSISFGKRIIKSTSKAV